MTIREIIYSLAKKNGLAKTVLSETHDSRNRFIFRPVSGSGTVTFHVIHDYGAIAVLDVNLEKPFTWSGIRSDLLWLSCFESVHAQRQDRLESGPAQRQARAAANHIYGIEDNNQNSFIGSSCIRVFEQNAASTGLNERSAKAAGLNYDSVLVFPNDMVKLMPDANYMAFKLVFSVPDGKILGAQAIGKGNVTKRVDVIAAMITMGATVDDLRELELCYSPVFGTAKDVVNLAAFVAQNILDGVFEQVHVCEVRGLVERGAYIIDVRNEDEFEEGHIKGAVNIPLGQIRKRMDEIPKDKPVYLHCRSSQRSYYALCALKGNGFDNIINISGSFLGISLYEYYRDKAYGREPIVTAYNFE